MNRRSTELFLILLVFGITLIPPAVFGQMTPMEILIAADKARGNVEGVIWEIEIESMENGRMQSRSMNIKAKGYNVLAEYTSPNRMKGRKILMIDRNMWFVKPGLRKPVPLSPRQKLMGQAANGDIASANYSGDYMASLKPDETVNKEACYCLDLTAVDNKATYERITYWVSKERMVGIMAHFFSSSGKLLKKAEFKYETTIHINGTPHPFISEMSITDAVMNNNVTIMKYKDARIEKVPAATFNINLLMM